MNLPLDFEVGKLDVGRVADIAVVASAQAAGYMATSQLLALIAGLPVPGEEANDFWRKLWRASGTAILLPANIRGQVLRALGVEGVGLADQLLTAVKEMDGQQRAAAAEVIGDGLTETVDLGGYPDEVIGELWLRDVELTAWRVLYADRRPTGWEERQQFQDAWKRA
jgi:hypothetical protein